MILHVIAYFCCRQIMILLCIKKIGACLVVQEILVREFIQGNTATLHIAAEKRFGFHKGTGEFIAT